MKITGNLHSPQLWIWQRQMGRRWEEAARSRDHCNYNTEGEEEGDKNAEGEKTRGSRFPSQVNETVMIRVTDRFGPPYYTDYPIWGVKWSSTRANENVNHRLGDQLLFTYMKGNQTKLPTH